MFAVDGLGGNSDLVYSFPITTPGRGCTNPVDLNKILCSNWVVDHPALDHKNSILLTKNHPRLSEGG